MKTSFRSRLIAEMVLLTVLILGAVGVVTLSLASLRITEISDRNQELLTGVAAARLDLWFHMWENLLVDEATRMRIQEDFSPKSVETHLDRLRLERAQEDLEHLLFIPAGADLPDDFGQADRRGYADALHGPGEIVYNPPHRDSEAGDVAVSLMLGVLDDAGETAGVLMAGLRLDRVAALLREMEMPRNSYCFLLDAGNGVSCHPASAIFPVTDAGGVRLDDSGIPGYRVLAAHLGENGTRGVTLTDHDGVERIFYAHHLGGQAWRVISAIDGAIVKSDVASLRRVFAIVGSIAVMFTVWVAFLMSTSIAYRINSVIEMILDGASDGEDGTKRTEARPDEKA